MANLGVLTALGGEGVTILSDALNHASIIDGGRLSRARVVVYRHLDLAHLSALLALVPPPVLVVSELVFSMDGDRAPVAELSTLCAEAGALLVLDEAHGVLEAPIPEPPAGELVHVGTLSKTLGSLGGYVAGRARTVDLVENLARPYIFTTASTPADVAAALAALRILDSSEGGERRAHLAHLVEMFAPGHPSPIVPVHIGSEAAALAAAALLAQAGIHVPAIRPPTVPSGTSRLRISLSAAHTEAEVASLAERLAALGLNSRRRLPAPRAAPRPPIIAVTGTATDVGKTHVAAELITALRARGWTVLARKPLQSFAEHGGATDAERLAEASGEHAEEVAFLEYSYPLPLAPPIAAARLGRPAPLAREVLSRLADSLAEAPPDAIAVVELVGGIASPHTADADGLALLRRLAPTAVLLVARPGLGTLNEIALAEEALRRALPSVGYCVLLNRYSKEDPVQLTNLEWLTAAGTPAVGGDAEGRAGVYLTLEELAVSRR